MLQAVRTTNKVKISGTAGVLLASSRSIHGDLGGAELLFTRIFRIFLLVWNSEAMVARARAENVPPPPL